MAETYDSKSLITDPETMSAMVQARRLANRKLKGYQNKLEWQSQQK